MPVTKEEYGRTANNQLVDQYTLSNGNGMVAKLINYGAALTELWIPDKIGKKSDVVLGWLDIKDLLIHVYIHSFTHYQLNHLLPLLILSSPSNPPLIVTSGYETNAPSFGVTIGRVVNRIANGQFALDGVHYQLEINDGSNHIHGGVINFSHVSI
ncbi:uncharacterized protein LOC115929470 [Strongylocentrotus purpuratus]|uniref:Galactose mutarotase n=1 Tax=Strongylocentrotus purpuratus TaxID=7668 RepID=A0A7M7PQ11_STRPU|nr:uncharacterized protein LOC115929470 [Strongylocentrotus purpuratus]